MGRFMSPARPLELTGKAAKLLPDEGRARLGRLLPQLEHLDDWREAALEAQIRAFAEAEDCKLGQIAQPLRARAIRFPRLARDFRGHGGAWDATNPSPRIADQQTTS